jgi:hypothetical protein
MTEEQVMAIYREIIKDQTETERRENKYRM